jgi:hypothetical protein
MDREPAAQAAVDAFASYNDLVNTHGLDSPQVAAAQPAVELAVARAKAAGCRSVDYDNARRSS